MIIMGQNRTEIFNLNGIYRLYVDNWINYFYIKAEKNNDDRFCAILGTYSTEERAKEVLMEMCFCYKDEMYRMPKE